MSDPKTSEFNRPCDYCGTLLNEADEEESNIPACGPRATHYASVCRERVHAALQFTKKDLAAAQRELAEALHWEDVDDEWTEAIKASHPTRGGSHEDYATAMRMVGHRHSKGQLVALVCWLLSRKDRT
jgi:hypothetical protein